jgi:hypothetical protein
LNAAVTAAQSHADPHLTPDGLNAKRATLVKNAQTTAAGKLQQLKASFDDHVELAKREAARLIPAAAGSTRDGWERVKMTLTTGFSWIAGRRDKMSSPVLSCRSVETGRLPRSKTVVSLRLSLVTAREKPRRAEKPGCP